MRSTIGLFGGGSEEGSEGSREKMEAGREGVGVWLRRSRKDSAVLERDERARETRPLPAARVRARDSFFSSRWREASCLRGEKGVLVEREREREGVKWEWIF